MGVSLFKSIESIIAFSINQSVAGSTDYVKTVPLLRDDWKSASLMMWSDQTSSSKSYKQSINCIVTDDQDKAHAQSINNYLKLMVQGYTSYYINNWMYSGYSYATSSYLSDADYDTNVLYLRFMKAILNGTNMKITWHNYASTSKSLKIQGKIKLSRKVLV